MSNSMMQKTNGFSLVPANFGEAMQFAKVFADSDLVPKDYKGKPANVLVAIQMGMSVGLEPMQALQNIAVINGRPAIWGDAILAIIQGHPDLEDIKEEFDKSTMTATCTIKRRGRTPVVSKFSQENADKAGLWKKQGPWSSYPERMLQMRARGFAIRDAFADAIKGIITIEEARDIPIKNAVDASFEERPIHRDATPVYEQDKTILLQDVLDKINSASSLGDMDAIAVDASKLTDAAEKEEARAAYKAKREALNHFKKSATEQTLEQLKKNQEQSNEMNNG